MADVDPVIDANENSTDMHKLNGDIKGSCDEDTDEPMEVDAVESPIKEPSKLSPLQNETIANKSISNDKIKLNDETKSDQQNEILKDTVDATSAILSEKNKNSNDTNVESFKNNSTIPHAPKIVDDEIHNISDSDEEDDKVDKSVTNNASVIDSKNPEIEKMDVDSNGHHRADDDDDKPVSINSDTDDEDVQMKDRSIAAKPEVNTLQSENKIVNGECKNSDEVHEILSDKEDCIVLDEKEDDASSAAKARTRKSTVTVRNFADGEDDDIQEIASDDPLHIDAQKSIKPMPPLAAPPLVPFSNQISIKDARSLATPPSGLMKQPITQNSFQQQFIQQQQVNINSSTKKEPTLVIIDTNSILAGRGGQAAVNQTIGNKNAPGVSVMPVGVPAQGLYSPRSSLTPIMPKTGLPGFPQVSALGGVASLPQLLPALTDDMFVLEAPSFIVPYIYEKPPSDNLKEIVSKMGVEIEEQRKKEELENAKEEKPAKEEVYDSDKEEKTVEDVKEDGDESTSSKSKKNKKKQKSGDDSWDELDTSTDDEASDSEQRTKVLIKEVDDDVIDTVKKHIITSPLAVDSTAPSTPSTLDPVKKTENYFESPLGKFFMNIGINLVQEHVQTDLLRQQKRKCNREGPNPSPQIQMAINSLMKNLEFSRETNEPFKFETKRCEYCNFKSESSLAMANHYETPHMRNYVYKCNFCPFETRPPHDILFHMEAVHNIKGRLEKGPHYHQCPNCPWEDNGKSKLARHAVVCAKKFRPDVNLAPPTDWEPPAKIPRIKPKHGLVGTANAYQAMAAQQQRAAATLLQRQQQQAAQQQQQQAAQQQQQMNPAAQSASIRARNRASLMPKVNLPNPVNMRNTPSGANALPRNQISGLNIPNYVTNAGGPAGQYLQVAGTSVALVPNSRSSLSIQGPGSKGKSTHQQPSISITPLPRQSSVVPPVGVPTAGQKPASMAIKPGQSPNGNGKSAFVICEICDGYIRDLDQLRNHMQWIHKIKIHPKMIYNRPPLNCQKCQYRFFTDQGLERHLLGSHGLVTSSMQEAANKAKDAGRCPVCGKVFQWKLLNHVSRDHNMTLKPAHLSYKCTVCTATFGMYKQFENHVYSAHSSVAKKSMENRKNTPSSSNSSSSNSTSKIGDSLLKPLKINDEITIIPQPASKSGKPIEIESHVID